MSYRDESLVGQELTEREAAMLTDHDAGMSANDLAAKYGYASGNGAGNVVRRALTKVGRGDEVNASTGGSTGTRSTVPDAEQTIRDQIDRAKAIVDGLETKLHEARAAAEVKPADVVKHETDRLQAAVDKATQARDSFVESMKDTSKKDEFVKGFREKASANLASLENTTQEKVDQANAQIQKMETALEAISSL